MSADGGSRVTSTCTCSANRAGAAMFCRECDELVRRRLAKSWVALCTCRLGAHADLVQEFCARMLSAAGLATYDPERRSGPRSLCASEEGPEHFRRWLGAAIRNFSAVQLREHRQICPAWYGPKLTDSCEEPVGLELARPSADPLFDRDHADATFRRAVWDLRRARLGASDALFHRAIELFRVAMRTGVAPVGRPTTVLGAVLERLRAFEIQKWFLFDADAHHAEAAQQLGITRELCRVQVHRLREDLQKHLLRVVALTLPPKHTEKEAKEEAKYLVQAHVFARSPHELRRAREWVLALDESLDVQSGKPSGYSRESGEPPESTQRGVRYPAPPPLQPEAHHE